ncbi:MAG: hypothetical protein N2606_04070 [Candidatus Omnitrophica bacterium]|nr:hypothetical protein [Candidatus Omnitrophota bacterium]
MLKFNLAKSEYMLYQFYNNLIGLKTFKLDTAKGKIYTDEKFEIEKTPNGIHFQGGDLQNIFFNLRTCDDFGVSFTIPAGSCFLCSLIPAGRSFLSKDFIISKYLDLYEVIFPIYFNRRSLIASNGEQALVKNFYIPRTELLLLMLKEYHFVAYDDLIKEYDRLIQSIKC